jgi:hypothetical protein
MDLLFEIEVLCRTVRSGVPGSSDSTWIAAVNGRTGKIAELKPEAFVKQQVARREIGMQDAELVNVAQSL